jgi:signal transduction histidine kinase
MSDANQYAEKIARLEKRLQREKMARLEAEMLLEDKSREIFKINQSLKAQVEEAKLKQKQLSFITGLSADIWHAETVTKIVMVYLRRAKDFLQHAHCIFFQLTHEGEDKYKTHGLFSQGSKSKGLPKGWDIEFFQNVMCQETHQLVLDANMESQLVPAFTISEHTEPFELCFLVPLFQINNNYGLACFFYEDDKHLDIFKLQTMESSRSMLTVAIQRKLGATTLQKRYKELKNTYQQLEDAQKQLVHNEKMASLGQLAAGVAHEINNPIGFILSNYETLLEYVSSLDEVLACYPSVIEHIDNKDMQSSLNNVWQENDIEFIRKDINELLNSSKGGLTRVRDIVKGLKSFSHMDGEKSENLNLNECLEDSVQLVWNELKYNCEVEKEFAEGANVLGNAGQLQQVFVNMLLNAKHAMEEGGKITLSTKVTGDKVICSISDTGSGISKENIDKLFTPFFTTKPVGVGTGLGLSISYGILQEHSAEIKVESEIGKGTTFIMQFPLA